MPRVTCTFCGLPFSVRTVSPEGSKHFCCSGCALASRIPTSGENLPISHGLVVALALGFGLFNELLFAVFSGAVFAEGRAEIAARFALVSGVAGSLVLFACVGFLAVSKPRRWSDALVVALSLLAGAWAARSGFTVGAIAAMWPLFGANLGLVAWLARGWARRAWRKVRGVSDLQV